MKSRDRIIIAFLTVAGAVGLATFGYILLYISRGDNCARISLPDNDSEVLICFETLDELQAEYRRTVFVNQKSQSARCLLPINPGGRTSIDAFWSDGGPEGGGALLLRDATGVFQIDLRNPITKMLVVVDSKIFMGAVPEGTIGYSTGKDENGEVYVRMGDERAKVCSDTEAERQWYLLGTVDEKFRFNAASVRVHEESTQLRNIVKPLRYFHP